FEIETEMTIHAVFNEMAVGNVIVEYRDRPEGSQSKLNTYSDGAKVLTLIVKLYKNYKPFRFFTWLATIMTLVAMVMFAYVFARFINSGLVENMPTLVVSGFIEVAAVQSFFNGMFLSDMVTKNRRDFELRLNELSHEKRKMIENGEVK
ncbi:MAG TPA: glycosyl transferase, partial [Lachnospiraceae bacterium]|nr:glycosyl transferase [Lachnospiraceae bacterium]